MAFLLNGREYYSLSFGMASNWDLKSAEMDDDCAQNPESHILDNGDLLTW